MSAPPDPADDRRRGRRGRGVALVGLAAALLATGEPALYFALLAGLLVAVLVAGKASGFRSRVPPIVLVVICACLLIPARHVVESIGSVGTPSIILGVLLLAGWGVAQLDPRLRVGTSNPVRIAVLVFVASVVASDVSAALDPLAGSGSGDIDRGLIFVLGLAGIALGVSESLPTRESTLAAFDVLVAVASFVAVLALVQFLFGVDPLRDVNIPGLDRVQGTDFVRDRFGTRRVLGTAQHPIELSVVLGVIAPIAVARARARVAVEGRRAAVPATVILFALPCAVSRSGILALVVGLGIYFAVWPIRRLTSVIPILLVGLLAARAALPGTLGTIRDLILNFSSDSSVAARLSDYDVATPLILERPIFGHGFRSFVPEHNIVLDNQFLLSLIETGVVGLGALILVFVITASCARGVRRRATSEDDRELSQALAGSAMAALASMFAFDALSFPMFSTVAFVIVGLTGAWRATALRPAQIALRRSADGRVEILSRTRRSVFRQPT